MMECGDTCAAGGRSDGGIAIVKLSLDLRGTGSSPWGVARGLQALESPARAADGRILTGAGEFGIMGGRGTQ
jgi:hypothetical protein